jgi:hypothetical protein
VGGEEVLVAVLEKANHWRVCSVMSMRRSMKLLLYCVPTGHVLLYMLYVL